MHVLSTFCLNEGFEIFSNDKKRSIKGLKLRVKIYDFVKILCLARNLHLYYDEPNLNKICTNTHKFVCLFSDFLMNILSAFKKVRMI